MRHPVVQMPGNTKNHMESPKRNFSATSKPKLLDHAGDILPSPTAFSEGMTRQRERYL
jgi:hypothetical protein